MKPMRNYAGATTITEQAKLPVGGYALKILNVEEITYNWGSVLKLDFDILEGDHKDFYKQNYQDQQQETKKWKGSFRLNIPKDDGSEKDEWTMRAFKTAITAFEESNNNFYWSWDEQALKGKVVGGLFRNKEWEYDGKTGFFTECCAFKAIDDIRNGKFKVPADKLLDKKGGAPAGFEEVADDSDDLPF